ncbi:MAG: amidohydrolase family protein [Acidobacteriota bacterium]|nr:amidohydrolase family protein [Acidobacteriota bacterium]
MKKIIVLLVILSATVFTAAQTKPAPRSKSIAFNHVTVIDMTGKALRPDMTVIITGDRISTIGKTGQVRVPKGATVVDGRGKYLIPGFWDMHVHLDESGKGASFPMYIANGVTGVRDMGGDFELISQWRQESVRGNALTPRIIAAGPMLDGPGRGGSSRITVNNAYEARQAVIDLKNRGVDFIKVHNRLSREAYLAIADETKKQGIPLAGHVPFAVTPAEASDAGQKSIEHLSRLPDLYDNEEAKTLFALFAKNDTWHDPTLVSGRAIAFLNDRDFTNDQRMQYIQPSVKENWDDEINKFFKKRTPEAISAEKAYFQSSVKKVGALHRAGVRLMTGTDVGNPYVFPGFSLHDELALFVKAGLTPLEALQAATSNPAEYLGLLDSFGTVEKGKIANLVLLEANPLENIRNTQKIGAVVLNGKLLPKELLQNKLSGAKAIANKK